MSLNLALALALMISESATGAAVPVRIEIVVPPADERSQSPCLGTGTLRAEAVSGPSRPAKEWSFRAPVELSVELEPDRSWNLAVDAKTCWAAPIAVPAGVRREPLEVNLWPAAVLRGRLTVPRSSRPPADLRVRIESAPRGAQASSAGSPAVPETVVACPVADLQWQCALPGTLLDARISAEGFIPRYLWDFELSAGKTRDSGILSLQAGASVSGWAAAKGRSAPGTITVELIPEQVGGGGTSARFDARKQKAAATARGFFQFRDVGAGSYRVVATAIGLSPGSLSSVAIGEPKEYVLRDTIFLGDLARLEILLDPPLDHYNLPWTIKLSRPVPLSNHYMPAGEGVSSPSGSWVMDSLENGRYSVSVEDSGGSVHIRREIEVTAGMQPVEIHLSSVPVQGLITAGDRALEADLAFLSGDGSKFRLKSSKDGEFAGGVSHEGDWTVEVTPVGSRTTRRVRNVAIKRKKGEEVAQVKIALAGGRIAGIVVDERGDPQAALVTIWKGSLEARLKTEDDGVFEAIGIEAGDAVLEGEGEGSKSGSLRVMVGKDGNDAPVRLVLRPDTLFRGRVISPSGVPMAGTLVRYSGPTRRSLQETVTDPNGNFSIRLNSADVVLDLVILAPGFPVKMIRVRAETVPTPVDVVMGQLGGAIEFRLAGTPPWPVVSSGGVAFLPLFWLLYPSGRGAPLGMSEEGVRIEFEPGQYIVCPSVQISPRCVQQYLAPGAVVRIDARGFWDDSSS
jgi:hypothetical protein